MAVPVTLADIPGDIHVLRFSGGLFKLERVWSSLLAHSKTKGVNRFLTAPSHPFCKANDLMSTMPDARKR